MRIGLIMAATTLCLLSAANAQTPSGTQPGASGAGFTTFIVKFKIKPGRNADFENIIAKLQSQLRASEPGNLYYDLYLPAADSQVYVLIEHYKDADAVKAHGKDPNTLAMATAIEDVLDGPPSADRLILVSSKR